MGFQASALKALPRDEEINLVCPGLATRPLSGNYAIEKQEDEPWIFAQVEE
jgi:hypothetical protein